MKKVVLLVFIFIVGCSQPSYDQIKSDFQQNNPGVEVISVTPGEGDSDNVYIQIRYKEENSETVLEENWLYQNKEGKWLPVKKN